MGNTSITNKIEEFLIEYGAPYEVIEDNMWLVHDDVENIVLNFDGPTLVFRVKVMQIPANNREQFFKFLLELNSTLLHGAYALEDEFVIITDSLEVQNLDFNEFQASLDSLIMSVNNDMKELKKMSA